MAAKLRCGDAMSGTSEAQKMTNDLIRWESRGAGDIEGAMRRLANRHGLNWRVFWTLKYRPPHDLFVSVYEALKKAHAAECSRQLKRLQHEIEIARLKGVFVDDIAGTVACLDKDEEPV